MPYVYIRIEVVKHRALLSAVHKKVTREEEKEEVPVPNTPGYTRSVVLRKI